MTDFTESQLDSLNIMMDVEKTIPKDYHPWSFIAEEMLARGWDMDELMIRMIIPNYDKVIEEMALNKLALDVYRHIGPEKPTMMMGEKMAAQFSTAFGIDKKFFLNLHNSWQFSKYNAPDILEE